MSRRRWAIVLAVLIVVSIASLVGVSRAQQKRNQAYQRGLAAEEAQEWGQACDIWEQIPSYRDVPDRLVVAEGYLSFEEAKTRCAKGEYITAQGILEALLGIETGPGGVYRLPKVLREAVKVELECVQAKSSLARAKLALERANTAYGKQQWAIAIARYAEAAKYNPDLKDGMVTKQEHAQTSLNREFRAAERTRERERKAAEAKRLREAPPVTSPARTSTSQRGREGAVAEYLDRLMALEATRTYINRAYQPDPDLALVYVDFKSGVPDWQIEKLVRVITEGVHKTSSKGTATVVAKVRGITVAEGNYKIFSGSIEVKVLR